MQSEAEAAAPPEAAPPEAAPPEAAPPEAAPPEAAPPEAAPPEAAPPEAAPLEAAPLEAAPPEAAQSEAAPPRPNRPRKPPAPPAPAEPPLAVSVPVDAEARPEAQARPEVAARRGALVYEVLWATGLPNVLVLARRELRVLSLSPIAYLAGAAALVATAVFGYLPPVVAGDAVTMAGVFEWITLSMAVATPLFAMGLLAREASSGTLEPLLIAPTRAWEVVVGKWLGALAVFLSVVALTLLDVVLASVFEPRHAPATVLGLGVSLPDVDYGAMVAGYLGVVLVGAAWVALGLLASSVTRHQALAAAIGIAALLGLQYAPDALTPTLGSPLADLLRSAGTAGHDRTFAQGQVVLRDVVYFVTLTAGALFLATRVVESRRWRR
jgi:ABC-2 type transport system permease protein